jgi:hypothetical protein
MGHAPLTGYAPTGDAKATHCTSVPPVPTTKGWEHALSPMYTTGSGPVRLPRLVPRTRTPKFTSAGHTATLRPVTWGGVYRNGTLALPLPATDTCSRTSPEPGPEGAVHTTAPWPTLSVTTAPVQAAPPMVTVVIPG